MRREKETSGLLPLAVNQCSTCLKTETSGDADAGGTWKSVSETQQRHRSTLSKATPIDTLLQPVIQNLSPPCALWTLTDPGPVHSRVTPTTTTCSNQTLLSRGNQSLRSSLALTTSCPHQTRLWLASGRHILDLQRHPYMSWSHHTWTCTSGLCEKCLRRDGITDWRSLSHFKKEEKNKKTMLNSIYEVTVQCSCCHCAVCDVCVCSDDSDIVSL